LPWRTLIRSLQVMDVLLPAIPSEIPSYQQCWFTTRLMKDTLVRCKQNVSLKELDSSPRLVESLAHVLMLGCELSSMGLFFGGDRAVWESTVELLDLGQRLITETRGILRFVGKSKLASLYKPLDRAALMLLTSDKVCWSHCFSFFSF
jgi:hypothetical protein